LGKYSDFIDEAASKYGVDADLIKAVITAESGGNSRVVSKAGAIGLMQLMPSTARGLGVTNAFDPKQNIEGGAKYLKSLIDRFSDIRLAIAGYNAGPGAVSKYGGIPPYSETRKYVERVTGLYADYKGN
jgi:soluble lytic murein transglycosylase-like protein